MSDIAELIFADGFGKRWRVRATRVGPGPCLEIADVSAGEGAGEAVPICQLSDLSGAIGEAGTIYGLLPSNDAVAKLMLGAQGLSGAHTLHEVVTKKVRSSENAPENVPYSGEDFYQCAGVPYYNVVRRLDRARLWTIFGREFSIPASVNRIFLRLPDGMVADGWQNGSFSYRPGASGAWLTGDWVASEGQPWISLGTATEGDWPVLSNALGVRLHDTIGVRAA